MLVRKASIIWLTGLCLLCCNALSALSSLPGNDSLVKKYSINDPRNPECKCHDHQELAEKQFRDLLKGTPDQSISGVVMVKAQENKRAVMKQRLFFKSFRRKKHAGISRTGKRISRSRNKTSKADACFKW